MTNTPPVTHTDPPDLSSMNIVDPITTHQNSSFVQTLLNNYTMSLPHLYWSTQYYLDMSTEVVEDPPPENFISLSTEDKFRLYSPWKYSIIVKVFGRKMGHLALKQKLQTLWKPMESLSLIDLGNDSS